MTAEIINFPSKKSDSTQLRPPSHIAHEISTPISIVEARINQLYSSELGDVSKVKRAMRFALNRHADQEHLPGFIGSYSDHILHVVNNSINLELTHPDQLCASSLHDILEDTDTLPEEIEDRYGHRVMSTVIALSQNFKLDPQKNLTRDQYWHNFQKLPFLIAIDVIGIKTADRLHNLQKLLELNSQITSENRKEVIALRWEYIFETEQQLLPLVLEIPRFRIPLLDLLDILKNDPLSSEYIS